MAVVNLFEDFSDLSQDFFHLLNDSDDYNITIQVGEKPDIKEFKAHSNILCARSSYFKNILHNTGRSKAKKKKNSLKINISPNAFNVILRYIYTGTLDLANQSGFDLLDILVAADELIIDKIINYVQKYIIKNESAWLLTYLVDVLHTVFKLQSCNVIQNYIMNIICTEPNMLFGLKDFTIIEQDIFLRIIKRGDLNSKEINIWNHLVKWGTVQLATSLEKSVEFDITKWDDNDFMSFKKILEPFLPYIRFYEISSEEFFYSVRPYREVLSENLYEDLMAYLMANAKPQYSKLLPRYGNVHIDSVIIGRRHSVNISSWIERKLEKLSCKFILSYRGTREKFNSDAVYRKCDNIVASLVLVKVKDSNKIIGGYNPLSWKIVHHLHRKRPCLEDVHWTSTNDSFIFCFEKNSNTHIISRVENRDKAIYNRSHHDEFSFNFGGGDLILSSNKGTCSKCNYEKEILDNNFFIPEEIEIFEVQAPAVNKQKSSNIHPESVQRENKSTRLGKKLKM